MTIVVWPESPRTSDATGGEPILPPGLSAAVREVAPGVEVLAPANEAQAFSAASKADGWIGELTPQLLAAAPRLRWVQAPTIILEPVLFPELIASDVVVTNMRNINGDHIANHALAIFLALCRDLPYLMRCQIARDWANRGKARKIEVRDPAGMTVLIVGMGSIGTELSRRVASLGSTIVGVDPKVEAVPPGVSKLAKPEELRELLAGAHAVIVCSPLTPETRGFFDEAIFRRMQPHAIFINVGRGPVVRLRALERALSEGWIAAAGIDVFETEPLPPSSPLWEMDNVILTPHCAGMGPHSRERRLEVVRDNVRRFIAGEPLVNVVDKARWY